jgi:energy-converting hydrogenase Eha subunit A
MGRKFCMTDCGTMMAMIVVIAVALVLSLKIMKLPKETPMTSHSWCGSGLPESGGKKKKNKGKK